MLIPGALGALTHVFDNKVTESAEFNQKRDDEYVRLGRSDIPNPFSIPPRQEIQEPEEQRSSHDDILRSLDRLNRAAKDLEPETILKNKKRLERLEAERLEAERLADERLEAERKRLLEERSERERRLVEHDSNLEKLIVHSSDQNERLRAINQLNTEKLKRHAETVFQNIRDGKPETKQELLNKYVVDELYDLASPMAELRDVHGLQGSDDDVAEASDSKLIEFIETDSALTGILRSGAGLEDFKGKTTRDKVANIIQKRKGSDTDKRVATLALNKLYGHTENLVDRLPAMKKMADNLPVDSDLRRLFDTVTVKKPLYGTPKLEVKIRDNAVDKFFYDPTSFATNPTDKFVASVWRDSPDYDGVMFADLKLYTDGDVNKKIGITKENKDILVEVLKTKQVPNAAFTSEGPTPEEQAAHAAELAAAAAKEAADKQAKAAAEREANWAPLPPIDDEPPQVTPSDFYTTLTNNAARVFNMADRTGFLQKYVLTELHDLTSPVAELNRLYNCRRSDTLPSELKWSMYEILANGIVDIDNYKQTEYPNETGSLADAFYTDDGENKTDRKYDYETVLKSVRNHYKNGNQYTASRQRVAELALKVLYDRNDTKSDRSKAMVELANYLPPDAVHLRPIIEKVSLNFVGQLTVKIKPNAIDEEFDEAIVNRIVASNWVDSPEYDDSMFYETLINNSPQNKARFVEILKSGVDPKNGAKFDFVIDMPDTENVRPTDNSKALYEQLLDNAKKLFRKIKNEPEYLKQYVTDVLHYDVTISQLRNIYKEPPVISDNRLIRQMYKDLVECVLNADANYMETEYPIQGGKEPLQLEVMPTIIEEGEEEDEGAQEPEPPVASREQIAATERDKRNQAVWKELERALEDQSVSKIPLETEETEETDSDRRKIKQYFSTIGWNLDIPDFVHLNYHSFRRGEDVNKDKLHDKYIVCYDVNFMDDDKFETYDAMEKNVLGLLKSFDIVPTGIILVGNLDRLLNAADKKASETSDIAADEQVQGDVVEEDAVSELMNLFILEDGGKKERNVPYETMLSYAKACGPVTVLACNSLYNRPDPEAIIARGMQKRPKNPFEKIARNFRVDKKTRKIAFDLITDAVAEINTDHQIGWFVSGAWRSGNDYDDAMFDGLRLGDAYVNKTVQNKYRLLDILRKRDDTEYAIIESLEVGQDSNRPPMLQQEKIPEAHANIKKQLQENANELIPAIVTPDTLKQYVIDELHEAATVAKLKEIYRSDDPETLKRHMYKALAECISIEADTFIQKEYLQTLTATADKVEVLAALFYADDGRTQKNTIKYAAVLEKTKLCSSEVQSVVKLALDSLYNKQDAHAMFEYANSAGESIATRIAHKFAIDSNKLTFDLHEGALQTIESNECKYRFVASVWRHSKNNDDAMFTNLIDEYIDEHLQTIDNEPQKLRIEASEENKIRLLEILKTGLDKFTIVNKLLNRNTNVFKVSNSEYGKRRLPSNIIETPETPPSTDVFRSNQLLTAAMQSFDSHQTEIQNVLNDYIAEKLASDANRDNKSKKERVEEYGFILQQTDADDDINIITIPDAEKPKIAIYARLRGELSDAELMTTNLDPELIKDILGFMPKIPEAETTKQQLIKNAKQLFDKYPGFPVKQNNDVPKANEKILAKLQANANALFEKIAKQPDKQLKSHLQIYVTDELLELATISKLREIYSQPTTDKETLKREMYKALAECISATDGNTYVKNEYPDIMNTANNVEVLAALFYADDGRKLKKITRKAMQTSIQNNSCSKKDDVKLALDSLYNVQDFDRFPQWETLPNDSIVRQLVTSFKKKTFMNPGIIFTDEPLNKFDTQEKKNRFIASVWRAYNKQYDEQMFSGLIDEYYKELMNTTNELNIDTPIEIDTENKIRLLEMLKTGLDSMLLVRNRIGKPLFFKTTKETHQQRKDTSMIQTTVEPEQELKQLRENALKVYNENLNDMLAAVKPYIIEKSAGEADKGWLVEGPLKDIIKTPVPEDVWDMQIDYRKLQDEKVKDEKVKDEKAKIALYVWYNNPAYDVTMKNNISNPIDKKDLIVKMLNFTPSTAPKLDVGEPLKYTLPSKQIEQLTTNAEILFGTLLAHATDNGTLLDEQKDSGKLLIAGLKSYCFYELLQRSLHRPLEELKRLYNIAIKNNDVSDDRLRLQMFKVLADIVDGEGDILLILQQFFDDVLMYTNPDADCADLRNVIDKSGSSIVEKRIAVLALNELCHVNRTEHMHMVYTQLENTHGLKKLIDESSTQMNPDKSKFDIGINLQSSVANIPEEAKPKIAALAISKDTVELYDKMFFSSLNIANTPENKRRLITIINLGIDPGYGAEFEKPTEFENLGRPLPPIEEDSEEESKAPVIEVTQNTYDDPEKEEARKKKEALKEAMQYIETMKHISPLYKSLKDKAFSIFHDIRTKTPDKLSMYIKLYVRDKLYRLTQPMTEMRLLASLAEDASDQDVLTHVYEKLADIMKDVNGYVNTEFPNTNNLAQSMMDSKDTSKTYRSVTILEKIQNSNKRPEEKRMAVLAMNDMYKKEDAEENARYPGMVKAFNNEKLVPSTNYLKRLCKTVEILNTNTTFNVILTKQAVNIFKEETLPSIEEEAERKCQFVASVLRLTYEYDKQLFEGIKDSTQQAIENTPKNKRRLIEIMYTGKDPQSDSELFESSKATTEEPVGLVRALANRAWQATNRLLNRKQKQTGGSSPDVTCAVIVVVMVVARCYVLYANGFVGSVARRDKRTVFRDLVTDLAIILAFLSLAAAVDERLAYGTALVLLLGWIATTVCVVGIIAFEVDGDDVVGAAVYGSVAVAAVAAVASVL